MTRVQMKTAVSNDILKYMCIVCALIGAFIGFLIPQTKAFPSQQSGIVAAIIAFELNYINLITTLGAVWLLYRLLSRKVRGREALVMYGALGFVSIRLILASLSFFHK